MEMVNDWKMLSFAAGKQHYSSLYYLEIRNMINLENK